MKAATWPPDLRSDRRLLMVGAEPELTRLDSLPARLEAGDVVVVNDAATLPAALSARTRPGAPLELRLAAHEEGNRFRALLMGAGDWRQLTEARPAPPELCEGEALTIEGCTLRAFITDISPGVGPHFATVAFDQQGAALYRSLYQAGRPIQYSHVASELKLFHIQNVFSARPWSFEPASAGNGLSWDLLLGLRRRGVEVVSLTHAAGISSTGSEELDRLLPLAERYEVPAHTWARVQASRRQGRRVLAVGTTVVRALESTAATGRLFGRTDLVLGPGHRLRVVTDVLSGLHVAGSSHHRLLQAFTSESCIDRSLHRAEALGLLEHEFGDLCWVSTHHAVGISSAYGCAAAHS